jgi:hypothetical protein
MLNIWRWQNYSESHFIFHGNQISLGSSLDEIVFYLKRYQRTPTSDSLLSPNCWCFDRQAAAAPAFEEFEVDIGL